MRMSMGIFRRMILIALSTELARARTGRDCLGHNGRFTISHSDPYGFQIAHKDGHLRSLGGLGDEVEVSEEGRGGVGARL